MHGADDETLAMGGADAVIERLGVDDQGQAVLEPVPWIGNHRP